MIGLGIGMDSYRTTSADAQAIRSAYLTFRTRVLADSGTILQPTSFQDELRRLSSIGVFSGASLIVGGAAGKASKLYELYGNDFTVTRASTKLRIGSNGLYGSVANNVPAFEFNTDGTYRGLLVEPGATNLLLRSQEFATIWSALEATITSDSTTSPDGTANADTITPSVVSQSHQVSQNVTLADSTNYTFSVYAKPNGYSFVRLGATNKAGTLIQAYYNVTTGTVGTVGAGGTGAIEALPNGWYRVSLTYASSVGASTPTHRVGVNSADNQGAWSGDGTSGIFIWQAQLETGSVATSPIVTTAGTASRVADVVSLTGASSLIGQQEGTVYAEVNITNYGGATDSIFTISDGTINNRIEVNKRSGATIALERASTTQSGATTISSGAMGLGAMKVAIAYKTGDTVLFINGVQIGSTALQTFTMSAIDRIFLGSNATGGTRFWNSNIRALAVFPTRLANATLASITA
jgi:hypothetical protein